MREVWRKPGYKGVQSRDLDGSGLAGDLVLVRIRPRRHGDAIPADEDLRGLSEVPRHADGPAQDQPREQEQGPQ